MNSSVYTSPGCLPSQAGITGPQHAFYNTLAGWMHQSFFQLNRTMSYFPLQRNDNTMVMKAFIELWPCTLLNTSGNLSFTTWRCRAARTILVLLAEHVWPFNIAQHALRELIDLARITPNVRLPHVANNAVLQRFTNLTMLFMDEPETLSATALLPKAGGQFGLYWRRVPRPPMRVQEEAAAASAAAAAAAREERPAEEEINLVDEEEEEEEDEESTP